MIFDHNVIHFTNQLPSKPLEMSDVLSKATNISNIFHLYVDNDHRIKIHLCMSYAKARALKHIYN